jgi:hypothetical protein
MTMPGTQYRGLCHAAVPPVVAASDIPVNDDPAIESYSRPGAVEWHWQVQLALMDLQE